GHQKLLILLWFRFASPQKQPQQGRCGLANPTLGPFWGENLAAGQKAAGSAPASSDLTPNSLVEIYQLYNRPPVARSLLNKDRVAM
ncbi:MAG: hypothetical protein ACRCTX_12395, partial [Afipia sp.]